ncbi:hypothetical protein ADL03_27080 [Nocardia sp. NRRL S-836]|nr:hypothetical protein ADL03_27080 [Nocardia sp. NRRL S-836]
MTDCRKTCSRPRTRTRRCSSSSRRTSAPQSHSTPPPANRTRRRPVLDDERQHPARLRRQRLLSPARLCPSRRLAHRRADQGDVAAEPRRGARRTSPARLKRQEDVKDNDR